jgi:hypothetical protein
MTAPLWDLAGRVDGDRSVHIIVATHTRELKTALFVALNAIPAVAIVATATSTAELASYCHAFRPDFAIVQSGLPGRSLGEVLTELTASNPESQLLLIDDQAQPTADPTMPEIEIFTDIDQLIATLPDRGADAP